MLLFTTYSLNFSSWFQLKNYKLVRRNLKDNSVQLRNLAKIVKTNNKVFHFKFIVYFLASIVCQHRFITLNRAENTISKFSSQFSCFSSSSFSIFLGWLSAVLYWSIIFLYRFFNLFYQHFWLNLIFIPEMIINYSKNP